MREPDRIHRILQKLMRYWAVYPDLRLGQIIDNIFYLCDTEHGSHFYMEDYELEPWLDKKLLEMESGIWVGDKFLMLDRDRMVTKDEIYED